MLRSIKALARHGFFAVSIDYRLSGVAPFPAAVEDSKCAVRWLRSPESLFSASFLVPLTWPCTDILSPVFVTGIKDKDDNRHIKYIEHAIIFSYLL
jgi:hypothetical protein